MPWAIRTLYGWTTANQDVAMARRRREARSPVEDKTNSRTDRFMVQPHKCIMRFHMQSTDTTSNQLRRVGNVSVDTQTCGTNPCGVHLVAALQGAMSDASWQLACPTPFGRQTWADSGLATFAHSNAWRADRGEACGLIDPCQILRDGAAIKSLRKAGLARKNENPPNRKNRPPTSPSSSFERHARFATDTSPIYVRDSDLAFVDVREVASPTGRASPVGGKSGSVFTVTRGSLGALGCPTLGAISASGSREQRAPKHSRFPIMEHMGVV